MRPNRGRSLPLRLPLGPIACADAEHDHEDDATPQHRLALLPPRPCTQGSGLGVRGLSPTAYRLLPSDFSPHEVYHNPMPRVAPAIPEETALLCEKCGYMLNGIPTDSLCPECASPIAESLPIN